MGSIKMSSKLQHLNIPTLSKATIDKVLELSHVNKQNTIERADAMCFRLWFPSAEECALYGLQAVNKDSWDHTIRHYRIRSATCKGMYVISSYAMYEDQIWHHVSFSLNRKVPTHDQTMWIKKMFVLANLKSIQIYPSEFEHVNIHPYCLHLWSCLEFDNLPDFRTEGMV